MTLGSVAGHAPPGAPSIGDRVFIGPHSVVVGGVAIGDDANDLRRLGRQPARPGTVVRGNRRSVGPAGNRALKRD